MKTKKIDKCEFELQNERLVFYPGEQICGNLHLHFNRPMDMKYIEISCKGELKTEWEKTYMDDEGEPYKVEFESKDKIFKAKQVIFGGDSRQPHEAGQYCYPFTINLPQGIPSSFETKPGRIRYELKMKIKKPWKGNLKMKKMFVVNELIDCNQPIYRGGPGHNDEKTLGCLCCASGPLTLSANLDRAAYCPGECILVTADVGNNTSRDMDKLVVKLVQKVEYFAKSEHSRHSSDTQTVEIEIAKIVSGEIKEGDSLSWKSQPMLVPPAVPSMTNNKFIKVKYFVNVWLDVPMGFDLEFNLPITMASVPYIPAYGATTMTDKEVKAVDVGKPPVHFLGYPDMIPHVYASPPKTKEVKLNKDEKEYQNNTYKVVYAYAMLGEANREPPPMIQDERQPVQQEVSVMPPVE